MKMIAAIIIALSVSGCVEEERERVKKDICSEIDRQNSEALAARDRANAGLTGGAKTPRVPTCAE